LTRYRKIIYQCDRPKCGAVHERLIAPNVLDTGELPPGWSAHEDKHFCSRHRVVVNVLDLIGEAGAWTEER
jgi:hypothetical protein